MDKRKKNVSEENIPPPLSLEELEGQFPALTDEIKSSKDHVISLRTENPDAPDDLLSAEVTPEKQPVKKTEIQGEEFTLSGFIPTAEDYIQRCSSEEEAEEIIAYLEKKGELDKEQAITLRTKLKSEGLSSFGEKRSSGYYERRNSLPHKKIIFKRKKE